MIRRKDSYFGIHLDLHPFEDDFNYGADISEENIGELLDATKPDYVTYDCKGHPGYCGYESKIGVTVPNLQNDSLAIVRAATKSRNIPLGIHYSGVQDWIQVRNNPNWAAQNINGHTDGVTTSTFGEYVDRLLIPQLKEVVEKYELNGVWLDGECWGAQLDYSPMAKKEWESLTGRKKPPVDKNSPDWQEWKKFHRDQFEKYLCHWTNEMRKFKPDLDLCSNWAYTTMMPKKKIADVDMISGDFDPFLSADRARIECRYLQNTKLDWELQSWSFDLVEDQDECKKMPQQLMQEASIVLMHGGGYMNYFLPSRGGYISGDIIRVAKDVSEFCRKRQRFSHKSTAVPQVGILYPTKDQLHRSDKVYTWWGNTLDEVEGILHGMLENQYSCDILAEHQILEDISAYPYIIVTECKELDINVINKLIEYAKSGGNLFICGLNAARLFEDNLGVKISKSENFVNTSLEINGKIVSARETWSDVELIDAEPLVYRYEAKGYVSRSSYLDIRETGLSEITKNAISKKVAVSYRKIENGQISAVYGNLPLLYFRSHHPYLREIFKLISVKMFEKPAVLIDSPYTVDISLRKTADGKLCLHLVNLNNMPVGKTRRFTDYIPEIKNIKVKIKCDKPGNVTYEPLGKKLEFSYSEGYMETQIESLSIHGVIVVD